MVSADVSLLFMLSTLLLLAMVFPPVLIPHLEVAVT